MRWPGGQIKKKNSLQYNIRIKWLPKIKHTAHTLGYLGLELSGICRNRDLWLILFVTQYTQVLIDMEILGWTFLEI